LVSLAVVLHLQLHLLLAAVDKLKEQQLFMAILFLFKPYDMFQHNFFEVLHVCFCSFIANASKFCKEGLESLALMSGK